MSNLSRLELVVDQIIGEVKKDPKTFFVHLGDIYHARNPVDVRVINFVRESLTRIKKSCSGFYYVRGNHEPISMQDGSPSLCGMIADTGALAVADEAWEHIEVPILSWRGASQKRLQMYFVPYFRDPQRQREEFKGPKNHVTLRRREKHDDVRLLFFHNSVTGVKRNGPDGVGLSAEDIGADMYDACIGGHEHMPQNLQPNITYCGSPCAMDWGEVNFQHRLLAIDIAEGVRR